MKAGRLMNTKAAVSLPFRLLDGLFAGNYTNVFRFAEPYVRPAPPSSPRLSLCGGEKPPERTKLSARELPGALLLPPQRVAFVGSGQGFAEFIVAAFEALALVKPVRVAAEHVAGELYLDTALREGGDLRLAEKVRAEAAIAIPGRDGELHYLGDARGVVELILKAQIALSDCFTVLLADKAEVIRIGELRAENLREGRIRQLLRLHIADERVDRVEIPLLGGTNERRGQLFFPSLRFLPSGPTT